MRQGVWLVLGAVVLWGACSSTGGAGASGGTLGSTDGGAQLLPGETCAAAAVCGRGSYRRCTVGMGTSCQSRYLTSDGQAFVCASCGECSVGDRQVGGWCSGGADMSLPTVDDSRCARLSSSACIDCCVANHPSGNTEFESRVKTCICLPSNCRTDCSGFDYCDDEMPSSLCNFCMQSELAPGGSCNSVYAACRGANPDCAALLECANACP